MRVMSPVEKPRNCAMARARCRTARMSSSRRTATVSRAVGDDISCLVCFHCGIGEHEHRCVVADKRVVLRGGGGPEPERPLLNHLAFLVGVIFFLYRLKDIVLYVSLFTIGHSLTLLAGVLAGVRANPYLIDAIIGFSVVYKAFDNIDGFKRFLGFQPNARAAVR